MNRLIILIIVIALLLSTSALLVGFRVAADKDVPRVCQLYIAADKDVPRVCQVIEPLQAMLFALA